MQRSPSRGLPSPGALLARSGLGLRKVLAGLSLVVAAGPALAAGPEPIRIGLIGPLTGSSADFGLSMQHGAELAVEQINEAGGYLGRPLQLVSRDDQGDPTSGRNAAIDLVTHEKVAATIGFCNTGVAMAALDLFEANRQVLMVPCATGSAVTRRTPAASSYVFHVALSDVLVSEFLAKEIVDRRKLARVAILADTTGYGDGGVSDLNAQLKRRGLVPVYIGRFAPGVSSLRSELEQARAAGAHSLVVYTVGPGEAVALEARAAMHWEVPFFGPWTLSFRSVLNAAGPNAIEGTMMAQSIIQDAANESRTAFVLSYAKKTGHAPIGSLMAASQAYDSVNLLLRAMFASHGDLSGPALKQALESPTEPYRGVVSTYDHPFSATDHEAFSLNMIWLGVWRGGEIRYFYNSDAQLSAAVRHKQDSIATR